MITLKQIEAMHWIASLGSFERAAERIGTTQSAISKRILDLESVIGLELFDRSRRGAKLTEIGEEIIRLGRDMLLLRDRIAEVSSGAHSGFRRLRLGVTELSTLTWLPRLVLLLKETFPGIIVDTEIGLSRTLHDRLLDDEVDIIVIPEIFSDPAVTAVRIGEVETAWIAHPSLIDARDVLTLRDLVTHTVIGKGKLSGFNLFNTQWLKERGASPSKILIANGNTATIGLAMAGLGVLNLPIACHRHLIDNERLCLVNVTPAIPPMPYAAMHKAEKSSPFIESVLKLIGEIANFSDHILMARG